MKVKEFINEKLEEWILVIGLTIMVLLVLGQVVSRYVINYPMGWSVELSSYLLIWLAWISASYAVQQGSHIRVEFIVQKFSGSIRKFLELLVLIIWFCFSLFLAIFGTKFILMIAVRNESSPSLEIPIEMVYLGLPIAGVLMSIRLIQQIYYLFKENSTIDN